MNVRRKTRLLAALLGGALVAAVMFAAPAAGDRGHAPHKNHHAQSTRLHTAAGQSIDRQAAAVPGKSRHQATAGHQRRSEQLSNSATPGKMHPGKTTKPGKTKPGKTTKPGTTKPGKTKPGTTKPGTGHKPAQPADTATGRSPTGAQQIVDTGAAVAASSATKVRTADRSKPADRRPPVSGPTGGPIQGGGEPIAAPPVERVLSGLSDWSPFHGPLGWVVGAVLAAAVVMIAASLAMGRRRA